MAKSLTLENIKQNLTCPVPVHVFESVTSTNTVASDMARDGAVHGTAVFACHQTQGRGRLGRSFASPGNSGIYMSVILKPDISNPVLITTASAVAVCRAISKVCQQEAAIKWVNDIYINNKKVCGILAEGVNDHKTGSLSHIVLGIGINCNADAIPAELADIAGAIEGDYSISELAAEVLNQLLDITDDLQSGTFIKEYKERSLVLNKTITVYKGGYSAGAKGIEAYVYDIDQAGGLVVEYTSGDRETLSSGEISIRL